MLTTIVGYWNMLFNQFEWQYVRDLPLDIKKVIASIGTWESYMNMYLIDLEFRNDVKKYGVSADDLELFIEKKIQQENNILSYFGGKYVQYILGNKQTCQYWTVEGKGHRDNDLPAYIGPDGRWWLKEGYRHRDYDLPAVIWSNGTREWWWNGRRHRDNDNPAWIWSNGTQIWFKNGKWHRDNDNPAVMNADGSREWWKKGKRHRDGDLPAWILPDGTQLWFYNGNEYYPFKKI